MISSFTIPLSCLYYITLIESYNLLRKYALHCAPLQTTWPCAIQLPVNIACPWGYCSGIVSADERTGDRSLAVQHAHRTGADGSRSARAIRFRAEVFARLSLWGTSAYLIDEVSAQCYNVLH